MHTLIAKYVNAYQTEEGSSTEKVKKILMRYAHSWDWAGSEALVADLIDDTNITAEDIIDFLADTYEHEGGNEEFHYAVRALQICLRKAHLAETEHHHPDKDEYVEESGSGKEDGFDEDSHLYMPKNHDFFRGAKY